MTASEPTRAGGEKPSGAQIEAQIRACLAGHQSTIEELRSSLDCREPQLRAALARLQDRGEIAVQTGLYRVRITSQTEGQT